MANAVINELERERERETTICCPLTFTMPPLIVKKKSKKVKKKKKSRTCNHLRYLFSHLIILPNVLWYCNGPFLIKRKQNTKQNNNT